jgi:hypothetical protein
MLQKALSSLTRRRFTGTDQSVSRWAVRIGGVPKGVDALILFSVEELAVNELRESFHHWTRTLVFPVVNGELGPPRSHAPAISLRGALPTHNPADEKLARAIFDDVERKLRDVVKEHAKSLTTKLTDALAQSLVVARKREDERYRSRHGEVSTLIAENTLAKLEKEIGKLEVERKQGQLYEDAQRLAEIQRSIEGKQAEIARRRKQYEEVRDQLDRERKRILEQLLPQRHAMSGAAQVFPVGIEVRLPGVQA